VNVYIDGTVQVTTGGTEMGQGLNTKIRQLVADEFGIDWDRVIVMSTSTEKIQTRRPPPLPPAPISMARQRSKQRGRSERGSLSTPPGVLRASRSASLSRPESVVFADGEVFDIRNPVQRCTFGELCNAARMNRIDLAAHGFYATPGVDYNRETGRGNPFLYYTQGAAVAEVEIDRFTGELSVPRVDLLIDIGRSINPGVDRGQVIGGFIQGRVGSPQNASSTTTRGHSSVTRRRPTRFRPSPTCPKCFTANFSRTTTTPRTSPAAKPSASPADARGLRVDRGQARAPLRSAD